MDFYSDNGQLLKRLYSNKPMPEHIKRALYLDDDKRRQLPDEYFAYVGPEGRYYPTYDAGNTAISVIYFMHNKSPAEAMKKTASKLLTACKQFRLEPPDELVKIATAGYREEPTPTLPTAKELLKVARAFEEDYPTYEPKSRRATAKDIVECAERVGMEKEELPEAVKRYAGDAINEKFHDYMEQRRLLLRKFGKTPFIAVLDEIEKAVNDSTIPLDLLAEELYKLDIETGLVKFYDDRIPDAYATIFSDTEDKESEGLDEEELLRQAAAILAEDSDEIDENLLEMLESEPAAVIMQLSPPMRQLIIAKLVDVLR